VHYKVRVGGTMGVDMFQEQFCIREKIKMSANEGDSPMKTLSRNKTKEIPKKRGEELGSPKKSRGQLTMWGPT